MKKTRAQGTIEYLLIIAVVVVIGLVVVSLLTQTFNSSSTEAINASSKITQMSNILSISEMAIDVDKNAVVTLTNNSGGSLIVTKLSINGADTNYNSISLVQGDKKTFLIGNSGTGCSCDSVGKKKQCNLTVYAQSEYGLNKDYTIPVTVDCVTDAISKDQNKLITSSTGSTTFCGDAIIQAGENCDGISLNGQTCNSVNSHYVGGVLGCNVSGSPSQCDYNVSRCVSDTNLALFYKFDGNLMDYSVNLRNGTAVNTPDYNTITGKYNQALKFNTATRNYFYITGASNISLDTNFTIATWVYLTSNPSSYAGEIVAKGGNLRFFIRGNDGANNGKLATTCGGAPMPFSDQVIPLNTWTHVALVFERSSSNRLTYYINGVQHGLNLAMSDSCITGATDTYFGTNNYGTVGIYNYPGALDNTIIWNRLLTAGEIADLNSTP
jgi:hypothetical protein